MNNQIVPQSQNVQLVQVEGKTYQIIQVDPQAIAPQPQPLPPQYIQPAPAQRSTLMDDQTTVILMGLGCVVLGGAIAWVVVKAFAPAPVPPAAPSTVIVQPPQPEKKPYTREECRPAGLFGWGQDCYRERGYQ